MIFATVPEYQKAMIACESYLQLFIANIIFIFSIEVQFNIM